jgi:autotransporter-associated beta strand protein
VGIACCSPQQLATAGTPAYQTQVLADSPFLYYRLNDVGPVAADISGNSRNGDYIGSPTLGTLGLGTASDNGVTLNGASQFVQSPMATGFGPLMGSSSYEFLFKAGTAFPTNKMTLAGVFNTGFTTGLQVNINEDAQGTAAAVANSVRLFLRSETAEGVGAAFVHPTILDGNYHHLLFTYDSTAGANRVQAYVDGVPQTVTLGTGANQSGGTPTTFATFGFNPAFGARQNRATTDQFFNGTLDETALYASTLTAIDAVVRAQALGLPIPNQWFVDGGGSFNTAANWINNVVPTSEATFGGFLTGAHAPATVMVNNPVSLGAIRFQTANQYILAGPSAVTLSGSAEVSATAGAHQIAANLAGTAGLTKTGAGAVQLTGAKSYTGSTSVQGGTLNITSLDSIDNQASTDLNLAAGTTLLLSGSAAGTLAPQLLGDGAVNLDDSLPTAQTVTINRSNVNFNGLVIVDGGTLAVANSDALGIGGGITNRTAIDDDSTARVSLSGSITIASEILDIDGRSTDAVALSSAGTNAWNGTIDGQSALAAPRYNIESTSQTLTLSRLHAVDSTALQTFVFSGAGNITVTGGVSEDAFDDAAGGIIPSAQNNVGVIKRGVGNLTIATGTDGGSVDFWFGPTVIEQGTLTVTDPIVPDQGELRSSDVTVKNGASLNLSAFSVYSQQIGQAIGGDGTIVANTLALFDDGSLAPGDSSGAVGSLSVTGAVTLSNVSAGGVWSFDVGNSANTSGDVLAVSGAFSSSGFPAVTVNVTPARGHLDAGARSIVTHSGGTNAAMNSVVAQITTAAGVPLTARQTVAISGSTAGQIQVVVTGEEATRTWSGTVPGGAWNVAADANWQQGDQQYYDLDQVVFNDSATGTTNVAIDGPRYPGSVTFGNATKSYNLTGPGGLRGTTGVNVSGAGAVVFANSGNDYTGTTTIAAGSSLRTTSGNVGTVSNSGALSLRTSSTTNVFTQNGAATIGTGAFRVLAIEAETFSSQTNNGPVDSPVWGPITSAPTDSNGNPAENALDPSLAGQALVASPISANNLSTSATTQNLVTYSVRFTQPGSYYWFGRMRAVDGGVDLATSNVPDLQSLNDDSLLLPSTDLSAAATNPQTMSTLIDLVTGANRVVNAEGAGNAVTNFNYDWYRSTEGALGAAGGFEKIIVTANDVTAGTVFQFKVATRESGMAMDKHVFVQSPNFGVDLNFGTLVDADLNTVAATTAGAVQTVEFPGTVLNVNGNFSMLGNASTLNMLVGSPNSHDRINVSGVLAADGVLTLALGNGGLQAQGGDMFDIFSFASATGAFDSIILPTLAPALAWDTSKLLVTGNLAVVSALSGDFDFDGDVDGNDFLRWQRGQSPNNGSAGDLAIWRGNFGQHLAAAASAAVPEPASAGMAVGGLLMLAAAHRRKPSICV